MLPFKSELTAFFSRFIPFSSIFFTVCPPRSLILTHTQVFSFFLFFCLVVGGVVGQRSREGRRETGGVCERE